MRYISKIQVALSRSSQKNSEGQYVFKNLCVCISTIKIGFLDRCRSISPLDSYFLNGPLLGQILTLVSRDANNYMYPIARGVFRRKSIEKWGWFCNLLG